MPKRERRDKQREVIVSIREVGISVCSSQNNTDSSRREVLVDSETVIANVH